MSTSTAIQWTDVTDNIIVAEGGGWWCRKISPGCANCYAEKLNDSTYFGGNHLKYCGTPPQLKLRREILEGWERMRKPKKHFVASMTDIFGEWVPREWIFEYLDAMAAAPLQTFQLLTKRADVMREMVTEWLRKREFRKVPRHIWLGVSVENQKCADERIPQLLAIPAWVRFLSVEPLLGAIDLTKIDLDEKCPECNEAITGDVFSSSAHCSCCVEGDEPICWDELHWVIVGGESGKKDDVRPCNTDWIRSILTQCQAAAVPCFVKQLGRRTYQTNPNLRTDILYLQEDGHPHYEYWPGLKDKKGGDMAEWPPDLRVREFPGEGKGK